MRRWILPVLAAVALAFSLVHMSLENVRPPAQFPPVEPARSPYRQVVAGSGLIEAKSENISVAAETAGVVAEIAVRVGQPVEKGQVLFRLDDRKQRSELGVQTAALLSARAELERLKALPRPEDLPPSAAKLAEAREDLELQRDQLNRAEELVAKRVIQQEELVQRKQAYSMARARLENAEAQDQKLRAGAWSYEIDVQKAAVLRAEQQVAQAQTEIDRLVVKSPINGVVLKVDLRPGEFVGTPPGQPLIIMGDLSTLHVRVDIDEQDIPRFRPGLPAKGFLRGDAKFPINLSFVRVEPYTQPKKSLTGDSKERVDTRVLQVIYAIDPNWRTKGASPSQTQNSAPVAAEGSSAARQIQNESLADDEPVEIYVGQQIDVFIDLEEKPSTAQPEKTSQARRKPASPEKMVAFSEVAP